jgi:hypothetical protein
MNTQLVKFKSKLCKDNRHTNCSKQWEGLVLSHCVNVRATKKGDDVSSSVSGSTSIIPLLGHSYERINL